MTMTTLRQDRRGATALEMAFAMPMFLVILFGIVCIFHLVLSRRAMDYGLEKALRYAAVHSTASAATIKSTLCGSAAVVLGSVGSGTCTSNVTLSPTTPAVNTPLTITYTYLWTPPATYPDTGAANFTSLSMTAKGTVYVVN